MMTLSDADRQEQTREYMRKYMRKYRANPENLERRRERDRQNYAKDPGKYLQRQAEWRNRTNQAKQGER